MAGNRRVNDLDSGGRDDKITASVNDSSSSESRFRAHGIEHGYRIGSAATSGHRSYRRDHLVHAANLGLASSTVLNRA
jgi:hypothetical protein